MIGSLNKTLMINVTDAENINTVLSGKLYRRAAGDTETVHVVLSRSFYYTCCKQSRRIR